MPGNGDPQRRSWHEQGSNWKETSSKESPDGQPGRALRDRRQDPQALQRFYSDAFGWRMEGGLPTYRMAYTGGEGGIDGGVGAAPDGEATRVTVYVQVEDLDAALRTIERLGGSRVAGPTDVPDGPIFALFTDPAGNLVGLLKAGSGQGGR